MICPKCGVEQLDALECSHCGVVVARWRARPGRLPSSRREEDGVRGHSAQVETDGEREGLWSKVRPALPWMVVAGLTTWWVYSRPKPEFPHEPQRARAVVPSSFSTPPPQTRAPDEAPPGPGTTVAVAPTPEPEVLPRGTCPLSDHGYGAPPSRARIFSSWYTSAVDYEGACKERDKSAAPMVVYVYADWCPYCRALERDLLSTWTVDNYLGDRAVKVKINPESGDAERRLADQLGVDGYPSFFVATPGGAPEELSVYEKGTHLKRPDAFVADIERRLDGYADEAMRQGASARARGRLNEAVALLTGALRVRPEDEGAYLERGRAHADGGSTEEALDDFARAARLRPDDLAPVEAAVDTLGRQQRWNEAIECWTSIIERGPQRATALLSRSRLLSKRGLVGLGRNDAEAACHLGDATACQLVSGLSPRL